MDFNYWGILTSPRGRYRHFTRLPREGLDDLRRQGVEPADGLEVTLYDLDGMNDDTPAHLENEGVLFWEEERAEWLVAFDRARFQSNPRTK